MKRFFLLIVAVAITATAFAQATTASLQGYVTDNNGKPLVGATVVATHLPTETTYGTVTDSNGAYRLQGLRVGAPYLIEFSLVTTTASMACVSESVASICLFSPNERAIFSTFFSL